MKKSILIVLMLFAALIAPAAHAEGGPLTLLINGSGANDAFSITLAPDGREYRIVSTVELEAGGDICSHAEEAPNELSCKATAIAGFEINAGRGDDSVTLEPDIPIPATLRGGAGRDRLAGAAIADKILGGPGPDVLSGRRGDDLLIGGPGDDRLVGGQGNDRLQGGPGTDLLVGGPGQNSLLQ